ncbi:MAG: YHS domain-containing (seleno)protein [Planctomycetota bacterium]
MLNRTISQTGLISPLVLILALTGSLLLAPPATAQDRSDANRRHHFNTDRGLALKGYDPVSYFYGGARRGNSRYQASHRGITYYFVDERNKQRFLDRPEAFEPAYGGWCAWAMRDGDKTDIDPNNYLLINDRLYVFYKGIWGDTKAQWEKKARREGHDDMIRRANNQWNWILRPGNR